MTSPLPTRTPVQVSGLDIGTGPVLIFPLLASRMYENIGFLASEYDLQSYLCAEENLKRNPEFWDRIRLRRPESPNILVNGLINEDESFDFCMCNPPFFSSMGEHHADPLKACTASKNEVDF